MKVAIEKVEAKMSIEERVELIVPLMYALDVGSRRLQWLPDEELRALAAVWLCGCKLNGKSCNG